MQSKAEGRPPHVGVDQQGRHPGLGAAGGELGREGRLTLRRGRAGDHQAAAGAFGRGRLGQRHAQVVEALEELLEPPLALPGPALARLQPRARQRRRSCSRAT